MAKLPARFTEGWAEDNAVYRTARKTYPCTGSGGGLREHSDACPKTIRPGDPYIEYQDGPLYSRGAAVSIACAVNYGYIKQVG